MHTSISKITIHAPVSRVWDAVTRPELVKQWQYGADVITDWQKGSSILFRNEWEGGSFTQRGSILEVEPGKMVRYSLFAPHPDLEEKPENTFIMTYTLEELNGQTTLTITQDDPRPRYIQEQLQEEVQEQSQIQEAENNVLHSLKRLLEA
jgi:uncharacterized protein YndB with AHSA1/START domain